MFTRFSFQISFVHRVNTIDYPGTVAAPVYALAR